MTKTQSVLCFTHMHDAQNNKGNSVDFLANIHKGQYGLRGCVRDFQAGSGSTQTDFFEMLMKSFIIPHRNYGQMPHSALHP